MWWTQILNALARTNLRLVIFVGALLLLLASSYSVSFAEGTASVKPRDVPDFFLFLPAAALLLLVGTGAALSLRERSLQVGPNERPSVTPTVETIRESLPTVDHRTALLIQRMLADKRIIEEVERIDSYRRLEVPEAEYGTLRELEEAAVRLSRTQKLVLLRVYSDEIHSPEVTLENFLDFYNAHEATFPNPAQRRPIEGIDEMHYRVKDLESRCLLKTFHRRTANNQSITVISRVQHLGGLLYRWVPSP